MPHFHLPVNCIFFLIFLLSNSLFSSVLFTAVGVSFHQLKLNYLYPYVYYLCKQYTSVPPFSQIFATSDVIGLCYSTYRDCHKL